MKFLKAKILQISFFLNQFIHEILIQFGAKEITKIEEPKNVPLLENPRSKWRIETAH